MKNNSIRTIGISIALIASLSACKGKDAGDTVATAPADSAAADATQMAPDTAAPANQAEAAADAAPMADGAPMAEGVPMAIPATADAIWVEINKHAGELKATIAGGDLKEVHHHAFAIRDLVAALPSHSPKASTEDQAKLDSDIKFVSTLADRLDQSGDAGDKAGAQASFDQLTTVLTGITRTK